MTTQEILDKLHSVKKQGSQWQTKCPAHDDNKASLSVKTGDDGRTLLKCHAGCQVKDICAALGVRMADLFVTQKKGKQKKRRIIAKTYDYIKDGQLQHQTVRYEPKDFYQRRPDSKGGWVWSLKGVETVLYNYDTIDTDSTIEIVFVVEGEKDADKLTSMGLIATTCPMGAKAWKDSYSETLRGRKVVLVPDNDESGRKHMRQVACSLWGKVEEIKMVDLPNLPNKGDISDWLKAGGTKEALLDFAENTNPVINSDILGYTENMQEQQKTFNLTDTGNAERLAYQYGDKIRHCHTTGRSMFYDSKVWNTKKASAEAIQAAIATSRSIIEYAATIDDPDKRKAAIKFAFDSERASNLKAMITIAKSLPPIASLAEDFDTNIMLLNVQNGTIDLETGILHPHNPSDMITQIAATHYPETDSDMEITLWLECLNTWHSGSKDTIDYLQRLGGYCLTGSTASRVFPIFYGGGKNGKSVFLDTIVDLLGDYATIAPRTLLKTSRNEEHATELASLVGKRLVLASETNKNMKLKVALVKAMTGDGLMKARFMRKDYFDFKPMHKVILVTQNLPIIDEASDAIWDRVHKMEWGVRISESQQNPNLLQDLRKEWPGILKWLVEGCLKWLKDERKLIPTESIREQTEEYRNSMNPVKEFFDDFCVIGEELKVAVTEFRSAYDTWCNVSHVENRLQPREFNALMRETGYKDTASRVHGNVVKCWHGIGLRSDSNDMEI